MAERLPSLRLVREEVRAEREAQLRHADALDAKAGIIVGFSGVLAAIATARGDPISAPGLVAAALAALLALLAFLPRKWPIWDLEGFRDRYVAAEPVFTERKIVDTQIAMAGRQRDRLQTVARLVKWAIACLFVAVVLLVAGTIASEIGG